MIESKINHPSKEIMREIIADQWEKEGIWAAVVDPEGKIIAKSNCIIWEDNDPTAHAEIKAMRIASGLLKVSKFEKGYWVYSTFEPCAMCASAIVWAGFEGVVFANNNEHGGDSVICFNLRCKDILEAGRKIADVKVIENFLGEEVNDYFDKTTGGFLTIDDGPTKDTKLKLDFLYQNNIPAILFCTGIQIEQYKAVLIEAVQKSFVIGNHGFNHKSFSEMTLFECKEEIKKTDKIIEELYREAGINQDHKLFRFPYGDKGGTNKENIQGFLKDLRYSKFDCFKIRYPWFKENGLAEDIDVFWTYDFEEYKLFDARQKITYNEVLSKMDNPNPKLGGSLLSKGSENIILIHDHVSTTEYFFDLISRSIKAGVVFRKPKFIKSILNVQKNAGNSLF